MKKREMTVNPSALTWAGVLAFLQEHDPEGVTNGELSEVLGCPYERVSSLTRVMYEAGAIARVSIGNGRAGGITFYFLPAGVKGEQ
ncbi:hypothetical protein DF159_20865 [Burkholderia ubonensis]|uniref:helix-turn-helix domain-containing protein n=1 Tax=Burkholderia ubonensis TaxID=101571 RepID=UPI000F5845BF|nr:helix-turn-helix domain-containing protein [Burkholderia ubonensis]RQP57998.1 hypothetical protein DF159_20865 [Burkholderia ubonensis]